MIFAQGFSFLASGITDILGSFIDFLISPISNYVPNLSGIIGFLNNFWSYFFGYFNWLRDALMIDSLTISLAIDIFTIKYIEQQA